MNISKINVNSVSFLGKKQKCKTENNNHITIYSEKITSNDSFEIIKKNKKINNIKQKTAAFILALSLITGFSGCANENNNNNIVNIQEDTSVSEGKLDDGQLAINDKTRKSSPMLAFGVDLYNELIKHPKMDVNKYIEAYLKEQNINNVSIVRMDNNSDMGVAGKFNAFYDDDLNYCGGELHLSEPSKDCDDKEKLIYCMTIAHELQHLTDTVQYSWLSEAKNLPYVQNLDEITAVNYFTSLIQSTVRKNLQYKPIVYLLQASDELIDDPLNVKISKDTAYKINDELEKYGFYFSEPYSKPLDNIIDATFQEQGGYDLYAESVLKYIFDQYYEMSDFPSSLKNQNGVNLFKSYFVYFLEFEAKAYEICSQMIKLYNGIELSEQTLNDLTPTAYRKLKDTIELFEYTPTN